MSLITTLFKTGAKAGKEAVEQVGSNAKAVVKGVTTTTRNSVPNLAIKAGTTGVILSGTALTGDYAYNRVKDSLSMTDEMRNMRMNMDLIYDSNSRFGIDPSAQNYANLMDMIRQNGFNGLMPSSYGSLYLPTQQPQAQQPQAQGGSGDNLLLLAGMAAIAGAAIYTGKKK